tara:strand:+ start:366 stop:1115 length:750 start_codon:yes stop_codon:yes gene_type:complete
MTRSSFAVAVPVGAWHPFLPKTLASLAIQSVPLEIAFLDASGDPRVAEAADASGLDFAYRRQGPDGGQSVAINEGWRETGSAVVFWLNADDQLLPGALEAVTETFETDPELDVVYGDTEFIDGTGARLGVHDQVADISALLLRSNVISQPSCFVQRRAVESVNGVNAELHFVMDWDLWIRLYRSGAKFRRLERVLSAVHMGEGTKTDQVTPRRLSEVFTLVHRNVGVWAAMKSTAAVAAETLSRRWRAL